MLTMVGIVLDPVIHVLHIPHIPHIQHVQILLEPLPMQRYVVVVPVKHCAQEVVVTIAQAVPVLAAVVLLVWMPVVLQSIPSIVCVVHLRAMPKMAGIVMPKQVNAILLLFSLFV